MSCPSTCILGQNLTFTIQAKSGTGAASDVDSGTTVDYLIYEDETSTEILSGSMAKLAGKTGFYSEQIGSTAANGFERYKTYTIRITATVSSISLATVYSVLCLGVEDTPSATTGALTTTALFKSYASITTADDDTLIGYLISRATSAIEAYCGRTLRSASYRERYDGTGDYEIMLNEYPITEIAHLATSTKDALYVTNTSSDAWNARVNVSATTMTLTIDGGASEGSSALTLSSYTVTTLVAAINALGSGWSASVLDSTMGVWDSDELLPVYSLECLNSYAYVYVPNESLAGFQVYEDEGIIYHSSGFPKGKENVIIRYTAGYVTTPADLEQICIDLVNTYYRNRTTDSSVKSEKLGDHSITYAEEGKVNSLTTDMIRRLSPYKATRL